MNRLSVIYIQVLVFSLSSGAFELKTNLNIGSNINFDQIIYSDAGSSFNSSGILINTDIFISQIRYNISPLISVSYNLSPVDPVKMMEKFNSPFLTKNELYIALGLSKSISIDYSHLNLLMGFGYNNKKFKCAHNYLPVIHESIDGFAPFCGININFPFVNRFRFLVGYKSLIFSNKAVDGIINNVSYEITRSNINHMIYIGVSKSFLAK